MHDFDSTLFWQHKPWYHSSTSLWKTSSLHASPSECTDGQETQLLWMSAVTCIPRAVAPKLPKHLQCWFQQHWATAISKGWHSTASFWPLSSHTPKTWSTTSLVFVLPHLPIFTINKEWKSNTSNYLLMYLKLTVNVFLSWNASLEDTGPSTLGRASKHFLYILDCGYFTGGASELLQHHLLRSHLQQRTAAS